MSGLSAILEEAQQLYFWELRGIHKLQIDIGSYCSKSFKTSNFNSSQLISRNVLGMLKSLLK